MGQIKPRALLALFAPLAAVTSIRKASAAARYLTAINDVQRTIVLVEVAKAGTGRFAPVNLPSLLIGSREGQAIAALPAGPCRRDLRVVYRDASTLAGSAWDSCRQSVLRIGTAHPAALFHH